MMPLPVVSSCGDEVDQHVERVLALGLGDVVERAALVRASASARPTADTRMPAAPPEPRYWFSHVVDGCRISALIFARVAGSVRRLHHRRRVRPRVPRPAGWRRADCCRRCRDRGPRPRRGPRARARVEALQHGRHAAPVLLVGGLQVMHDGRHAGLAGDAEHLVEALVDGVGLGALVRDVAAAEAARPRAPAPRARRCARSGRARTAATSRRRTPRPPSPRRPAPPSRASSSAVAARSSRPTTASRTPPALMNVPRLIVAGRRVEHREVAGQVAPRRHAFLVEHRGEGMELPGAADAPRCVKLASPVSSVVMPCMILLATRLSRSTQYSDWPSMSMKPGATTRPRGVDAARGGERVVVAHRRDAAADDADVGGKPRRAGAVDDAAAGDEQVARGRLTRRGDERRGRRRGQSIVRVTGHVTSSHGERATGPAAVDATGPASCIVRPVFAHRARSSGASSPEPPAPSPQPLVLRHRRHQDLERLAQRRPHVRCP